MSEKKDPAIKLFGKTIKIGSNFDGDSPVVSAASVEVAGHSMDSDDNILCSKHSKNIAFEQARAGHETDTKQDEEPSSSSSLEVSKTRADPTATIESHKALSDEKESLSKDESKKEDQLDQTSGSITQSQDQCLSKKPDKIIPCPRCNSMETKFCYFNNYNVNQPRHFCKNCQRYWTAGGTMRNVPVGAGRRKSKSSSSSSQVIHDTPSALIQHALSSNGTLLTFGGQGSSPLSQSMASMLKLVDKSTPNHAPNGINEQETRVPSPCGCSKNGKQDPNHTKSNDKSICCNVGENTNDANRVNSQSLPPPLVCFTTNSWPYTWNPIPIHSGYPMSFYSPTPPPPPFLPCNPLGTWNYQWIRTPTYNPENQSHPSNPNPDSPSLGKHSRDANEVKTREENKFESSRVVMPKTLRIDDPIEAANNSILGTLGINKNNNDKLGLLNNVVGARFFGGFEQPKDDNNNQEQDNQINSEGSSRSYLALQANPAAFSRSLSFHENAY